MKKHLAKIITLVLAIAMCAICFTACVPDDYAKAETKLKDAGFTEVRVVTERVEIADLDIMADLGQADKITAVVIAEKDDNNKVCVVYFSDAKYAKANYKKIKLDIKNNLAYYDYFLAFESNQEQITTFTNLKKMYEQYKVARKGNVLVYGIGEAYKAATK